MHPSKEFLCTVKSNQLLTATVFELIFETNHPLQFQAGQFLSVVIPGAGPKGRDLRRAYSIASPPEAALTSLCVKLVEEGPGTTYLSKLKPGDSFKIQAPYGDFIYHPKPDIHVFFIATGTGISPFRSMLLTNSFYSTPPLSTTCLLGVRDESELLFQKDLSNLPQIKWVPALSRPTSQGSLGFKGRVTDYIRSLGPTFPWKNTEFYLCGNGQMIEEVKTLLSEHGVLKTSIHQEVYYKPENEKGESNEFKK